ncbi:probable disease resistance protein At4g27220 [Punica granatum]|uniref:Probable disease resistance protein At4g27220 n=1 Tax=Punica granatum TaxID=22663 RepID=A0A6P8E9P1_PUNGR|nr:probable disease resistance protein At4g27220 [Punica granatum]XP_031403975.1 probable disease resistance protein At4g27220 [Punica granatum]XP_031403976.1 probable disease resistance protein At4g27220 [Punica granatum]
MNLLQEVCGEREVEGPSNAPEHINNRSIMPISSVIRGLQVETDRPENSRMSLPAGQSFHLPEEGNQDPSDEVVGSSATPILQPSTGPAGGARDAVGGTFKVRELVGQESQRIVDEIWDCLTKNNISRIGVYGMAGVGKTTVLKHLRNKTHESAAFRGVFWVTVSKDCTIHELQNKIAERTKAQDLFKGKDDAERSTLLFNHLREKKNTLMILDDMWQHFELLEVGMPEDGIQLVLTTRDRAVCQEMLCQKEIKVDPLPYNDAWTMFVDTLGSNLSPSRERIARCIVQECKGLPLAIVVMAGSMRGVDGDYGWEDTLEKLRQSQALQQDMRRGVFPILQHSYNCLDPKKQQCLLRCALYPEDEVIKREELIEFCIDEGVIHGDNRRKMHNEGHRLLDELEKACLLEPDNNRNVPYRQRWRVRMHDVIRDMAICIMSADKSCMVKSGLHLDDVPDDEDEWFPNLQRVSLTRNGIEVVPSSISPNCPQLSTLLLSSCWRLREISGCFFERMGGLKVINLSDTSITKVPESITNLEKLRALILDECFELSLLPSLEKLTSLRKLDLQGCSEIKEVPHGLGMLVNLTYLNFSGTGIERIPDGVISKLQKLQHLIAGVAEVKGEEVGILKKLELIRCRFQNVKELNKYTQAHNKTGRNPCSYIIFIGGQHQVPDHLEEEFEELCERFSDVENIRFIIFNVWDGIGETCHLPPKRREGIVD